jgi:hypothetical protein
MSGLLLLARLAPCLLLCVGAAAMPRSDVAPSSRPAATQLAGGDRSYRSKEDDSSFGTDEPQWSRSSGVRVPGQLKSNPSGYAPERIHRFWRHYHGARLRSEDKPKRPKEAR